jgi:hypothetical protein
MSEFSKRPRPIAANSPACPNGQSFVQIFEDMGALVLVRTTTPVDRAFVERTFAKIATAFIQNEVPKC